MLRGLSGLILVACSAFAQPTAKLVTLDIAAVGPHGHAISDLRSDEIQIVDNKRAQSVVYWRSNERSEMRHVTVVLFSLQHAGIKSAAWGEAVSAMRRFEASDYLYFYAVTDRGVLLPIHALPEPDADTPPENMPWMDRRLMQIESARNLQQPPWDFSDSAHGGATLTYAQDATLRYAQELATRLAAFPGRKNLICIDCLLYNAKSWDTSVDAPEAALATELRQLAVAFHQARVAVYPVGKPRSTTSPVRWETNWNAIRIDEVDGFARVTGGRAYVHGEIEHAIAEAISDGRSSYRIDYLPPADNWEGKIHEVRIVSSRPGVRMLAPTRYFADKLEDVTREWMPSVPGFILTSPIDQSDIGVSISQPDRLANALHLRVRVNAADLLLLARNGRYSGNVTIQTVCYSPEGRRLACAEPWRANLDLSQQQLDTALHGGLWFPLSLPLSEVSAKIRVVVYDEISGAAGSTTVPAQETH